MPQTMDDRAAVIIARSDQLATHTEDPGIIHRPYGSASLRSARDLIASWMQAAGMITHVDAIGNLFGRYAAAGGGTSDRCIMLGGHFDSVRDAGRYDGTLGVLTAISVVGQLNATATRLPVALEVAAFADEEGLRFKSTFMTSSPLGGRWDDTWLEYTDSDGMTLRQAMREFGADPEEVGTLERKRGEIVAFIETHIEQGPVLEAAGLPVAAVSCITGSKRAEIDIRGMAGHAGTVPMAHRQDALAAMAEIILTVESTARIDPDGLVATIGKLVIEPGGPNVIAGHTLAILDLRHPGPATRERGFTAIRDAAIDITNRRDVTLTWTEIPGFVETPSDPHLLQLLDDAIAAGGITPTAIPSGAGHDAVTIANIAPVVMLFVRCRGGISHNPTEHIEAEDVAVAIGVVDRFVGLVACEQGG